MDYNRPFNGEGDVTRVCPECGDRFGNHVLKCPLDGAPTFIVDREDELIGRDLDGRFTIRELIGAGGMGAVYRAYQHSTDRDVALKLLKPEAAGDEQAIKRFFREARAASRLANPHTITVFDFGQTGDGLLFIAMELLKGRSLGAVLKDMAGPMDPVRAVGVVDQVLDSLEEAHGEGILHRDLKPDNIHLLDSRGKADFVKVLDFGIAKLQGAEVTSLTATGMAFGTPTYMSPEQAQAWSVDRRSDLYSVGVILFEMVAGRPPFEADTPLALVMKKVQEKAPPVYHANPDVMVPEGLERFLASVLAVDVKARPADATEARALLGRAMMDAGGKGVPIPDAVVRDQVTQLVPGPSMEETGAGTVERQSVKVDRRPLVGLVLAVLVGAGLAFALATWQTPETSRIPPEPVTSAPDVMAETVVGEDVPEPPGDVPVIDPARSDPGRPLEVKVPSKNPDRKKPRRRVRRKPALDHDITRILKTGGDRGPPDNLRLKKGGR